MRAWHLWLVGLASLFWNAGGAFDYLMTRLSMDSYTSLMTAAQRAHIDGFPVWVNAGWAIAVWGAVLGSVMLLLRSRLAGSVFGLSLVGIVATTAYGIGLAEPSALEVGSPVSLAISEAVVLVAILLLLYARAMTRRGVLS